MDPDDSKTRIVRFELAKLFPTGSPIAIDILRLMGGCNDIYQLIEWVKDNKQKLPEESGNRSILVGRFWLQTRLLMSCFYESLTVIQQVTKRPEFSSLRPLLGENAERDLQELEKLKISGLSYRDSGWGLDEALARARNKTTFHYDPAQIEHTLRSWQTKYPNQRGDIVIAGEELPPYYDIVELIRTEISFGIRNPQHDENWQRLLKMLGALNRFVACLFFAYVDHSGLGDALRRVTNPPNAG